MLADETLDHVLAVRERRLDGVMQGDRRRLLHRLPLHIIAWRFIAIPLSHDRGPSFGSLEATFASFDPQPGNITAAIRVDRRIFMARAKRQCLV
jgi:hypothetical protein